LLGSFDDGALPVAVEDEPDGGDCTVDDEKGAVLVNEGKLVGPTRRLAGKPPLNKQKS
jgi:hypothetical protein